MKEGSVEWEGALSAGMLRGLRMHVFVGFDSLCRLIPVSTRAVTVVVRLDAIGDFFIWMQSGAADISRWARSSGYRVILVANCLWADYARETGLWDDVIALDPTRLIRSLPYRLVSFVKIRRLGAALLIQPRSARVFLQEDAISRVSGAACRIGNAGTLVNMNSSLRRRGNRFYDKLIAVSEKAGTHETVRNDQFVLGLTGKHAASFEFPVVSSGLSTQIVVALGAGQARRVWPADKLAQLVSYIKHTYPQLSIVVLGLRSDLSTARRLDGAVSGIDNRVGQTNLREYIESIAAAKLVICNDSSAYHIAMAYRRAVLCFLGGGHYGWFGPYPPGCVPPEKVVVLSVPMDCFWCNWNCRYPRLPDGAVRCIASISVESAVAAVDRLLAT